LAGLDCNLANRLILGHIRVMTLPAARNTTCPQVVAVIMSGSHCIRTCQITIFTSTACCSSFHMPPSFSRSIQEPLMPESHAPNNLNSIVPLCAAYKNCLSDKDISPCFRVGTPSALPIFVAGVCNLIDSRSLKESDHLLTDKEIYYHPLVVPNPRQTPREHKGH
jgi:hypothetical protein